jgi:RimJ/RimL family protein N-acetyltransferase
MSAPVLHTARLTLGPLSQAHLDAFIGFCASDASRFVGGPAGRADAWEGAVLSAGHWVLRGYGYFWLTETASGQPVGRVGVTRPDHWPEAELAWTIYPAHQGQGFATEAARLARDWAARERGLGPLMSVIHQDNAASIRVAEKLGARLEKPHANPDGKPLFVWRHPMGAAA